MAGIVRTFLLKLVLEQAIEAEEKAYLFYEHAIGKVKQEEAQELLKSLASAELRHRLTLEETQREGDLGRLQVSEDETVQTIEAISEEWPEITTDTSVDELLEIALTKEKNAVAFYTGLRDNTVLKSLREVFDTLANEEKKHVRWIEREQGKGET
jgi:rubrerythrin